jgi:hypothetical protein
MNSSTAPEFWKWFARLRPETQARDRKAYRFWRENHTHPSLHFKKVGRFRSVRTAKYPQLCTDELQSYSEIHLSS